MEETKQPVTDKPVPDTQVVKKPVQKNSKKLHTGIAALVVAVLLMGFAYWLGQKDSDSDSVKPAVTDTTKATNTSTAKAESDSATKTPDVKTPTTPTKAATNCPSSAGYKTFYNKIIGLEFCYPKEWGEATVSNVEASASVAGGAYEIHFASKDGMSISSATADWKNTVARDGRCADPQTGPIQFSTYQPDWTTEGSGMAVYSALRVHIKQEPEFLIRELASEYYNGVCLMGFAATLGGSYDMQTINLLRSFGGGITTVKAHVDNPTILIPVAERTQFAELVASIKHAK